MREETAQRTPRHDLKHYKFKTDIHTLLDNLLFTTKQPLILYVALPQKKKQTIKHFNTH